MKFKKSYPKQSDSKKLDKEQLEQVLQEEWDNAREYFYYPQLPKPRLVEFDPNGGSINFENLEITLDPSYLDFFASQGITPDNSLSEILTHELTHYMKFPGSVLNIFRLQKIALEETDAPKAKILREEFLEAQTNIFMGCVRQHPYTAPMRKLVVPSSGFTRLMYAVYQDKWGKSIDIEVKGEDRGLVHKLSRLDYLNKEQELDTFRDYVKLAKDWVQKELQEQEENKKEDNGLLSKLLGLVGLGNDGKSCNTQPSPNMQPSLLRFSDLEIEEGLRMFAAECENQTYFVKVVESLFGEIGVDDNSSKTIQSKKYEPKKENEPAGTSAGTARRRGEIGRDFYSLLAKNYTANIRKKPLEKRGGLYPYSHSPFSISDSFAEMDPFSTPGIMPGITKKWNRREGESYGKFETVPNSIIVIDNSGSMVDPEVNISVAVLGGTVIANAYLNNGAKVAVYGFGGENYILPFTQDRNKIHAELRRYTNGGTIFSPEHLNTLIEGSDREFDLSIISDMDIDNLNSFIKMISKMPKSHRIHLLYTAGNNYQVESLSCQFKDYKNIGFCPIKKKEDLHQIVLGELKKSIL